MSVRISTRSKKRRILPVDAQPDQSSIQSSIEFNELKGAAAYEAERGNFYAAVELFTGALKRSPNHYDVLLGRGNAYFRMGKFQEACDDADQVVCEPLIPLIILD